MTYDRRDWEERQIQALKKDIAERLRSVCERVPDEEFDQLVDRIARTRRKYEQRRSEELFSSETDGYRADPSQ
jgi:hypothetical protein